MEMRQLKQKNIAGILVFWELCKIDKNVLETVYLYKNIRDTLSFRIWSGPNEK